MSAYPGDSIELYLNAEKKSKNYNLKLYDLSGKEVTHVQMMVFPQTAAKEKAFETGFGYKPTKKVVVPALRSGVYLWENIFHLL